MTVGSGSAGKPAGVAPAWMEGAARGLPGGQGAALDPAEVVPDAGDVPALSLPPLVARMLDRLPFMPAPVRDPVSAPLPGTSLEPLVAGEESEPAAEATPVPEPAPAVSVPVPAPRRAAAPLRPLQTGGALFPGLSADGHAAHASGTVIHTDALEADATRLANVDVAFSGATFTSEALTSTLANEMARIVAPTLGAGASYGRGTGIELGVANPPSGESDVILAGMAEALAPPTTALVTREETLDAAPAAVASLLRGQARSLAAAACTTGVDLSFGHGYAADVGLVGAADSHLLSTQSPAGVVSTSTSRTRLVPQAGAPAGPIARFGLMSETRQVIAPVTFFQGTPQQFTIQFGGEFVLRATADGRSGDVFYGPGTVEPETPLLSILDAAGNVTQQLNTQQIFGDDGLVLEIPDVAEIAVGERPRAIGGGVDSAAVETATLAAGAVDVVRVRLFVPGTDIRLADLRIGHMEAAAAVPDGGIECGLGLVKVSDKAQVSPGEEFTWTLTVSNPNDCVLSSVRLVDTITTPPQITYSILSTQPPADSQTANTITWNDLGPIPPGGDREVRIHVRVGPDSGAGRFLDQAVATAECGPAEGEVEGAVRVPLEARVELNLPEVIAIAPGIELPRTGGLVTALPALLLLGLGAGLRRFTRRR